MVEKNIRILYNNQKLKVDTLKLLRRGKITMNENDTKIKKVSKTFGERFLINIEESKNKVNQKGLFENYFIDDEFEVSFFKITGEITYETLNISNSWDNMRIVYFLEGECLLVPHLKNDKKFDFEKNEVLIHRSDIFLNKYSILGEGLECIVIEFNIYRLIKKLFNVTVKEEVINWEEKIFGLISENNMKISEINLEILYLLKKIKNMIIIRNMSEYLRFKVKIEELLIATLEMYINLEERTNFKNTDYEIVRRAKEILDRKNIAKSMKIQELCETMKITRYHLQSAFESVEGVGIFEYIQRRKMEYSRNLLLMTDKSILEIANEVGYKNPSKFSEIFQKYFGILPSKYRLK